MSKQPVTQHHSPLDKIFEAIGEFRAEIKNLSNDADKDRQLASERHKENLDSMERAEARVESLEHTVGPLVKTVADMKPIVEGVQISKLRMSTAWAIICAGVGGIAWVFWLLVENLGGWFIGKIIGP